MLYSRRCEYSPSLRWVSVPRPLSKETQVFPKKSPMGFVTIRVPTWESALVLYNQKVKGHCSPLPSPPNASLGLMQFPVLFLHYSQSERPVTQYLLLVQTWTVAVLIGSLWNCMIILIVELEQIQLCGTQRTGFTGMYRNGILSTYLATLLCRNATVCVTYVILWSWFRRIKKERATLAEKIQEYFKFTVLITIMFSICVFFFVCFLHNTWRSMAWHTTSLRSRPVKKDTLLVPEQPRGLSQLARLDMAECA